MQFVGIRVPYFSEGDGVEGAVGERDDGRTQDADLAGDVIIAAF